jgi:hypothetical protein
VTLATDARRRANRRYCYDRYRSALAAWQKIEAIYVEGCFWRERHIGEDTVEIAVEIPPVWMEHRWQWYANTIGWASRD